MLNRQAPLNAQSATENYLANFKDDGDDDDDYVEIRSEDEGEEQKKELPGTAGSMQTLVKGQQVSTSADLGYMWNDPDCSQQGLNQPTIVQSLRDKFQCLGSSSIV